MQPWQAEPNAVLAGPPIGSVADYSSFRPLVSADIPLVNPSGGKDYFVDGNSLNTVQDGDRWATAFVTLAEALAASHARIANATYRSWAVRNRIFCVGDALVEDLTKLAQKTDVIGVGQCDGQGPGARLQGNHVIEAVQYYGTRFINFAFLDNDANGKIWTLITEQGAAQFLGCDFLAGASTTHALLATAVTDLRVKWCNFRGSWNAGFSTAAIALGAGTGHRTEIDDNTFENQAVTGSALLVDVARAGAGSFFRRNAIQNAAIAIDDNSDTIHCIGNRVIVGTAKAAGTSVDLWTVGSADNIVTGSDGTIHVPVQTD